MEWCSRVMDVITVGACTMSAALLCSTLAPHMSRDTAWALVSLFMGAICLFNVVRSRRQQPDSAIVCDQLPPANSLVSPLYPTAYPVSTPTVSKFLAPSAAAMRPARTPAALHAGKQAAADAPVGPGVDTYTLSDGTVIDWDDVINAKSRHYAGFRSMREGKTNTIELVKSLLEENDLVFSFPLPGLNVVELKNLRAEMPEDTTVKVVKNKLMERAINESDGNWSQIGPLLKESSVWVFSNSANIKSTFEKYDQWAKGVGDKAKGVQGAVMEGTLYDDAASLKALRNLPTREELMTRLAIALKSPTTRLARVLKQPARKVAVAIKLASENEVKDGMDQGTVTLKELEIIPNEPKEE